METSPKINSKRVLREIRSDDGNDPGGTAPQSAQEKSSTKVGARIYNFLLGMVKLGPIFACLLLCSLVTTVLLNISVVVVRILQYFMSGPQYETLTGVQRSIRFGLFMCGLVLLIGLGMCYPFVIFVPTLKHQRLLNLPLSNWIAIMSIVTGLPMLASFLNCVVYAVASILVKALPPKYVIKGYGLNARQAIGEIIDNLLIWWASHLTMKHAPFVRGLQILGLPIRKWIDVSVLVSIGYNLIVLLNLLIVYLLHKACQRRPKDGDDDESGWQSSLRRFGKVRYIVYYARGMRVSINFLMTSLMPLLTWIFYFGPNLDNKYNNYWELGMWSFVSLLICSFLWVIKNTVLLIWKANTLYDRLDDRILSTRKKSYFLRRTTRDKNHDVKKANEFYDKWAKITWRTPGFTCCLAFLGLAKDIFVKLIDETSDYASTSYITLEERYMIEKEKELNLDAIQELGLYLFQQKQDLIEETYLSTIQHYFESRKGERCPDSALSQELPLPKLVEDFIRTQVNHTEDDSSDYLNKYLRLVLQDNARFDFPYSKVRTWVERAHNQWLNLAHTIGSAEEVADCLNKIISWLLIGAIFIMWLLLTGFATTKVLVLIASPLLATTFIFGDTCKTLFQGIIYVFVVHPFDVGDLCVIEDNMMEVRAIGIWTTTFIKVDKFGTAQELAIHANSELASKTIINHKTKFDWSDRAEFDLGPSTMARENMKLETLNFFVNRLLPHDGEEEGVLEKYGSKTAKIPVKKKSCSFLAIDPSICISANHESIILVICLEYNAGNTKEWTYSECLRRKNELKGDFHLYMQHIICDFKVELEKLQAQPGQSEINESSLEDVRGSQN